MKTYSLIMLLLAIQITTLGQNDHKIKGRVVNSITGEPLPYATLNLKQENANFEANEITDDKGKFRFSDIPDGRFKLLIHFVGFEVNTVDVDVSSDGTTDLGKLLLTPSISQLDGPTITAEQQEVNFRVDKQVVNVSGQLAASGGTAADALQVVPSIQVDAAGNVLLRGSADFMLLVDGRPSVIQAEDLLSQMQAASIQRIEIVTNPSVKYEAEGNTGIINIITKKDYLKGTEAMTNLMWANGDKYAADVMINKRMGKFRSYLGYKISDKTKVNESITQREIYGNDTHKETFDSERKIRRYVSEINLGTDYFATENTTITLNGQIGEWKFDRIIPSTYSSTNSAEQISATETYCNGDRYLNTGLNIDHKLAKEGNELVFDAYLNFIDNTSNTGYRENNATDQYNINNNADKLQGRAKLDYTGVLSEKTTIETGAFFDFQNSDYKYLAFESSDPDGGNDNATSIQMQYTNLIPAAYALLTSKIGSVNIKAGLRGEATIRELVTNDEPNDHESIDFFPSLHLSTTLKEKHTLSLGFSRRINRPSEWQLSPLVYSADRLTSRMGNPDLLPEFTNAIELGHYYRNEKWNFNTQFFYRDIHNAIASYTLNDNGSFIETYDNLESSTNAGTEFMFSYSPVKWLQLRAMAAAYYSKWKGSLSDGNQLENSAFVMNGNFTSTFIAAKNTRVQFLAVYYAPSATQQGNIEDFYYFDFIVRQQFLDKKLNLTLRTHNTFDTGLLTYTEKGTGFFSETNYRYEGPTFIISLSYKLNNFRKHQNNISPNPDFDSGLDH